jgi:moderate conductance mechanosensitive channel
MLSPSGLPYNARVHDLADEIRKYTSLAAFGRIVVLLLLGIGMEVAARVFIPRVTARVSQRASQIVDLERRQRSATVVKFSTSVVRLVLWTLVFVSLLSEININIGPLLAGAGVVGAALAFGAQNIIKDYLAGFFILLENQYTLGDVVRIGALSGTVEEISMRITVLRGVDGAMHVIPNGTITAVSNMTSAWARVIVDVGVAYTADLDVAVGVLTKVASDLHADETWGRLMLEPPEVVGLNALTETAMVLRVMVKVIPEYQWKVQRELLRRIKLQLDANHVSAPPGPLPVAVKP